MERSLSTRFFKDERQKTDDSLIAEREKTNESLTNLRSSAERQTDKDVKGERRQADQTASDLREVADSDSNKKRVDSRHGVKAEIKISSEQLSKERDRSDKAVELERSQVDLAIKNERKTKSELAGQLLEQERKLTDKNLSGERIITDSKVQQTIGLLSDEVSAHSKTKVSLTTRDEFLAIVSHDLRNPIGAASMCAEMLLEDPAFQTFGSEARKSVELIKRNIDTSLRLISDLLDMERIEGGKLQLKFEKHNLDQILREAVESFAHAAAAKSVVLKATPSPNSRTVVCDKDRILQVLSNLIGNALKFTPAGGSVTLKPEFNESEAQISICDSGPGVPEEKRIQIFERYAQLGVNNRVGLGLGLYISKMLVEAHKGRLWVTSMAGGGSTFSFTIPYPKVQNDANAAQD